MRALLDTSVLIGAEDPGALEGAISAACLAELHFSVLVELTPKTRERVHSFYGEHLGMAQRLYDRYTLDQLEMLLEFVRGGREFNEQQAALLEEQTRRRAAS